MDQLEFPFFKRVNAPSVVSTHWVNKCKTYREAVLTAWVERTMKGATAAQMCRDMGFRAQHVSDWFAKDNAPSRRSLPAYLIPDFESYVGNTLVSQWLASKADLTVFEQEIATKACA